MTESGPLDNMLAQMEQAREYVDIAERRNLLSGRNPSGVAAACLYAGAEDCGAALTQADAADVADVTPVTLRSTYYDLQD